MNEDLYSEETRKFMSEEKKTSIKAEVFSWVKVIVSAIIIALLVDFFIIANAVVPTGSMETTIPAGSWDFDCITILMNRREAISLFSNTRMMRVLII